MHRSPADPQMVEFLEGSRLQLSRLAIMLTGDRERADDLVQDTLVKVIRKWSTVRESSNPVAYSCRILTNQWRDDSRRAGTRRASEERAAETRSSPPVPADQVLDRMTLHDAIAELAPKQRAAIYLRYYEDLSVREVAERLGCSEGTVKSQTSYALRSLAKSDNVDSSWERK